MYSHIKEKHVPSSPTRYTTFRRVVPRHLKAYLWLCFLVMVFGYMLLLDNGISIAGLLQQVTIAQPASQIRIIPTPASEESVQRISSQPRPIVTAESVPTAKDSQQLVFGSGTNAFTPDDVVILFKTGATSLWHRVPIHLSTTLSDRLITPNIAMYSDQEDNIAGQPIIDVLANVSSTLKSSTDFELYRKLKDLRGQNLYLEYATIDGDHWLPGGWRLDKYKFLPLMSHAAAAYPDKKWYIYMEDDNYFFWHSLYHWLSTFDPSTPRFLGGPAARLGEDFAHGGSGFMVSGAAMSQVFGANPNLHLDWESYTQERCCGDQVLSHVMAVHGVPRDRRYDHTGWVGLQAVQHWRMAFGHWNWCSPLFNVHKVHQADVSRLHALEQQFQATHGVDKVMTWGTLFDLTVAADITSAPRKVEWDNDANEQWFSSKEADQLLSPREKEQQAWYSADACEQACRDWALCLSWKYSDDNCGLSSNVVAGRPVKEGNPLVSGYLLDRVQTLRETKCPSSTST